MILELINKIDQFSREKKLQASLKYRSSKPACVPFEEFIAVSPSEENKVYLVHKNIIFENNSICDSSYTIYVFDENGNYLKEEKDIEKSFFNSLEVVKKL